MSRGTISNYSSRNLDACALQLNSWRPFVTGDSAEATAINGENESTNALLLAGRSPTRPVDIKSPRSSTSGSATVRLVKCSFKQVRSRSAGSERFQWSCRQMKEVHSSKMEFQDSDSRRKRNCIRAGEKIYEIDDDNDEHHAEHTVATMECEIINDSVNGNKDSECCDILKDVDMMMPEVSPGIGFYEVKGYVGEQASISGAGDSGNISVISPSPCTWSKRQNQLSRALARGLWRWKEGSKARKRRRKGGSSVSGSCRSSDSRRARVYISDPPTVGFSGPHANCSDIPVLGTDSSGEFFFYGEGGGLNWDSDFPVSGEAVVHRKDGADVLHAWISSDAQSLESGYGSEPGYRGDAEVGYEDDGAPDEQDDDDRQQLRLSPWRETGNKMVLSAGGIFEKEAEEEDFMGDPTSSSEAKAQHRLRIRRHKDLKLTSHRNKHF